MEVERSPAHDTALGKKRKMFVEDDAFRTSKRRLTQAMDELHLGGAPAQSPEWGAPFGQRTRLRVSRRPPIPRRDTAPLTFGESFKRALDGADDQAPKPVKRRRNNDSRALVVYRAPNPNDVLPNTYWTQYPKIPRSAVEPIVEFLDDENEVVDITGTPNDEECMEIVIGEEGSSDMTKGALVKVPRVVHRRRLETPKNEDEEFVRSQTAILMPWHENSAMDGDVNME